MSWKNETLIVLAVIAIIIGYRFFFFDNHDNQERNYRCVVKVIPTIKVDSFYYPLDDGPFVTKKAYHRSNLDTIRLKKIFYSWNMDRVGETITQSLIREGISGQVRPMIPNITKKNCNSKVYMGLEIQGPFERRGDLILIGGNVFARDQFFKLVLGPYAH